MKKYDSYKDSGVEWIGEIPSGWRKSPIKYYYNYKKGSRGQELTKTYIQDNLGEYPVYSGQTENEGVLGRISEYEFDFPEGVIFTTTVGVKMMSTKVLRDKFSLSQNCLIMIPKKEGNSDFVNYFISVDWVFRKLQFPKILQPSLRMEDIDQYFFYCPTISEQQQIVSFLDTKTSLIDSLIEKTYRKIELLKEKRTSLINEVVTKGLNPNVEMKDSGVEWIGEIPSHWEESKLKHKGVFFSGYSFDSNDFLSEGEIRVLKISNIQNNGISWDDLQYLPESFYDTHQNFIVNKGDLVFVLTRPIISTGIKVCFFNEEYKTLLNQRNSVFRPNESSVIKRFLFYSVRTFSFIEEFKQQLKETNQPNISTEQISNILMFFPPLSEQQQIVEYLDEQTGLIDKTVSIEEKRIELLKEYRQSLISEVVTGKRKVV
jgi:type I restriction enzyme S subunit